MQITVNKNNPPIPHRDFFSNVIGKKQFIVSWYPEYRNKPEKQGKLRTGTFDLKKRKWWKRADGTYYVPKRKNRVSDSVKDDYVLAFDHDKKDYRYISYSTIKYIKLSRKSWLVDIKRDKKKNDIKVYMKLIDKKLIH